jgi:hypothetical protein
MRLQIATANVWVRLPAAAARACIEPLLSAGADLIALQECSPARALLLRRCGDVRFTPGPLRLRAMGGPRRFRWVQTLGDCTVGMDADHFDLESARPLLLAGFTRAESATRPFGIEPPQIGLVVRCGDQVSGDQISLIDFHLTPGVQHRGSYREDRPRLVARHRLEVRRLEKAIAEESAAGRRVYAAGDGNFDGLELAGLASAWSTQPAGAGTYGNRRIDDVFSRDHVSSVRLLEIPSDHRAVLVEYAAARERGWPRYGS